LDKFVIFGSDRAFMMTGICNGVAARLKDKVNPFLLSIHYITHRTNLAFLNATNSAPYKKFVYFA